MSKEVTKERSKQYYFFKSFKYLKPYKGYVAISIASCIIAAALSVLFPVYTEKVLNAFTMGDGSALLMSAGLLLLFQIAHSVTHMVLWGTTADKLRARVTRDIRYNTVKSIVNLKTTNFDFYGSGKLIHVVSADTSALSGVYTNLVDVFMSMLSKIAIFVYIFVANYILGFYCLLEFAVVCLAFHFRIRTRMKDQVAHRKEADVNISLINETIRGVRDVKNFNIQESMLQKADNSLENLEKLDRRFGRRQYQLFRMTVLTRNIMAFMYIPFALLLIHFNLVSYATAFTIFVFRTDAVSFIDWFMNSWEYIKDGGFYAERIFNVIDGYYEGFENFPEKDQFKKLPKRPNIEIKDLTFGYIESDAVLKDFSINIEKGSKIAIVGESGSGKSTILKLLNRTYDVERGKIFIGGNDVCDFSKKTLRDTITIVSQDPYIFNFSIMDNLKIIDSQASKKKIVNACKKAQIHDFIMSLPNGYETKLGEGGTRLSGGQKPRLAIARAFLKDSPILIFDETTSALDNENQEKIKQAIDNISTDKIVIIVAHRLSTIVDTDCIYFLKDGKIIASGTHQQLLKNCEDYCHLYFHESVVSIED